MKWLSVALAVMSVVFFSGCNSGEGEPTEEVVAFEGTPDERFVAVWVTPDNNSKYVFKPSGDFDLAARVQTPGGVIDTNSSGQWRVNGEVMLFKDQAGNVAVYTHSLNGDKLTLTAKGSMGRVTELIRSSEGESSNGATDAGGDDSSS